MSAQGDLLLWHALQGLEVAYWHEVDLNEGRNAHQFYLPDGIMIVGHNRFQGRDDIRKFYEWRARQAQSSVSGATTTRHVISNVLIASCTERTAKVVALLSLYGGAVRGRTPQAKPPILLADVVNECVLGEDDKWLYKSHDIRPVFVSHESPLSMAVHTHR
jgi:hypothetical protein